MAYTKMSLEGRTAVVIGGTSGIGLAIVRALAEAGADVVPTSRRPEQVEAAAAEVEALGRRTLRAASDVGDRASLEALLARTVAELGAVDVLVNAAGRTARAPTVDFPEQTWSEILDTNLTGVLRACQVFGRHMIDRSYGRIVNIASLASFVALYEVAAYSASKAAVASLTKSLAVEWARHNVCVNAIAPGVVPTELNRHLVESTDRGREFLARTPAQRFGRANEIAGAAVFLASDAASYVNGEVLVVDGGFLASGVNR